MMMESCSFTRQIRAAPDRGGAFMHLSRDVCKIREPNTFNPIVMQLSSHHGQGHVHQRVLPYSVFPGSGGYDTSPNRKQPSNKAEQNLKPPA